MVVHDKEVAHGREGLVSRAVTAQAELSFQCVDGGGHVAHRQPDLGERELRSRLRPRDQLADVVLRVAKVHGARAAPAGEVVLLAHLETSLPRLELGDVKREVMRRRLARHEGRRRADVLPVPRRQCVRIGCREARVDDPHRARC